MARKGEELKREFCDCIVMCAWGLGAVYHLWLLDLVGWLKQNGFWRAGFDERRSTTRRRPQTSPQRIAQATMLTFPFSATMSGIVITMTHDTIYSIVVEIAGSERQKSHAGNCVWTTAVLWRMIVQVHRPMFSTSFARSTTE
jgi:hypothetical protein